MNRFVASTLGVICLAGCSGGSPNTPVVSDVRELSGADVNVSLDNERRGSVSDPSVGTAAYVLGFNPAGTQLQGYVGVSPHARVGLPLVTGAIATYNAAFEVAVVRDIRQDGAQVRGNLIDADGTIQLTANLRTGRLTGAVPGIMSVDGAISGNDLDGSVLITYPAGELSDGELNTDLEGFVGGNGVVGAFHGTDENTLGVGVFVGPSN